MRALALALVLTGCGDPPPDIPNPGPRVPAVGMDGDDVSTGLTIQSPGLAQMELAYMARLEADGPERYLNEPMGGWVDLRAHVPGLKTEIRYHTANNFTGAPLPGYGAPGAWLLQEPADALVKVQADLAGKGLGLLVYDAYRPKRGTLGMVAWAERTDQVHLLDTGYIARVSGHNRGNTIDLTLIDLATEEPVDMGSSWDTLSEVSHTNKATGEPLKNRHVLKDAMEAHGFAYYWKEWWHFSYEMTPRPKPRDTPYGCFEPEEGSWKPAEGWNTPGFEMPLEIEVQACPGRVPALMTPDPALIEALEKTRTASLPPKPTASGGLSLADIDRAVTANETPVTRCLSVHTTDPLAPRKVLKVELTVAPDGSLTSVDGGDTPFGRCIADAFKTMSFDPADEPTTAVWTLSY